MYLFKLLAAAKVILSLTTTVLAVEAEEVYDGGFSGQGDNVQLKIANGGAGQSGLVKELANAFIQFKVKQGAKPFQVAWYKSDTTYTIKYLQSGVADVGITYSEVAEKLAIQQGIATEPSYYIFRDHFYLTGPKGNPHKIDTSADILAIFADLYAKAEAANLAPPVRFLARYDKSATSIKDSELWLRVGQVPWAYAYSTWYHVYPAFPLQALRAAMLLDEYTITDRGTFLSSTDEVRGNISIYKRGSDDAADPLLNPAHLLIGTKANAQLAREFARWTTGYGQDVIENFKKNGCQLYTGAPVGNPFDLWTVGGEKYHFAKSNSKGLVNQELKKRGGNSHNFDGNDIC